MPFSAIIKKRKHIRNQKQTSSSLKKGIGVSPYTFSETLQLAAGAVLGSELASTNPRGDLTPGRSLPDHVIGVRSAELNKQDDTIQGLNLMVLGDVMVSATGKSIQLKLEENQGLYERIKKCDILVMNVEAPVTFEATQIKRTGLNFTMSSQYLHDLVMQLRAIKPDLVIVYDIANNHSLDQGDLSKLTPTEKALQARDSQNFPLLRTVAAIKEKDAKAFQEGLSYIVGAHLEEDTYQFQIEDQDIDCRTHAFVCIERKGIKIGIGAFTDLVNHNNSLNHWEGRVVRTEDLENLADFKQQMGLDHLHLIGHGHLEQCIYPQDHFREEILSLLKSGADAFTGHGPHVILPNEIITQRDEQTKHPVSKSIFTTRYSQSRCCNCKPGRRLPDCSCNKSNAGWGQFSIFL